MQRDYTDDPEAELRRRLQQQYTSPDTAPDPAVDQPVDTPPPASAPPAPSIAPLDRGEPPSRPDPTPPPPPTPSPAPPAPAPPTIPLPTPPTPPIQDNPAPAPAQAAPAPAAAAPSALPAAAAGLPQTPHMKFIWDIFQQQGKTPTPQDVLYWEGAISRANGDLNYIRDRMLQPDTGGSSANAAAAPMNFQQALQYVQSRLGRTLSQQEIEQAFRRFGGTPNDTFQPAGLDPVVAAFRQAGTGGLQNYTPGGLLAPSSTGSNTGSAGGSFTYPQGLWGPDFLANVRALLMQRLQSASAPVSDTDPTINAAMTAARDEASRASTQERANLAEHLYAQGGLNTDAITRDLQQSGERTATTLGSLRATLMQRELDARRSDLQNLLQLALATGDAEATNAIRVQLAYLDAQVQREGIGANLAMFGQNQNANATHTVTGA